MIVQDTLAELRVIEEIARVLKPRTPDERARILLHAILRFGGLGFSDRDLLALVHRAKAPAAELAK